MLKHSLTLIGCRGNGPNSVLIGDDIMAISYIVAPEPFFSACTLSLLLFQFSNVSSAIFLKNGKIDC